MTKSDIAGVQTANQEIANAPSIFPHTNMEVVRALAELSL